MKVYIAAVVAVLALAHGPTLAQTTYGDPDCGQWVKSQNITHKAWLLGYLSGLNMGLDSVKGITTEDYLDALNSADQAFLWMDNYCQKNPLNKVSSGAVSLFMELMDKKK